MKIVSYEERHFPAVIDLLRANWAASHALYEKCLFDWQHRVVRGAGACLMVEGNQELAAFLGVIPSTYLLDRSALEGAALTMWCVAAPHRRSGLGPLLLREVERRFPVTLTLGCNQEVVPLYQRMHYSVLPRLHRYYIPCAAEGFQSLLNPPMPQGMLLEWWGQVAAALQRAACPAHVPNAAELEATWSRGSAAHFRFAQRRDAAFWSWRFIDNVGFRYHRLSLAPGGDAAVVRVERVIAPGQPRLEGLRVLRILELLPGEPGVWADASGAGAFAAFLSSLLKWGHTRGCVAADFQCSSRRLEPVLLRAGFRRSAVAAAGPQPQPQPQPQLVQLFQPFRPDAEAINFVWKVTDAAHRPLSVDSDDTWFVKSDADMDRTNFWPVIAE
jgi:GNAT superfamily N-acetyltransferase